MQFLGDVLVYIHDQIGDDSNPGTADQPVKTLAAAGRLLPDSCTGRPWIIDANPNGGTYTMPTAQQLGSSQELPGISPALMPVTKSVGARALAAAFIGSNGLNGGHGVDVGIGTRTVGAVTAILRSGVSLTKITDQAGGLTPHALVGKSIRITTGTSRNVCMRIDDNTATDIVLVNSIPGLVPDVDQYVVERPSTTIQMPQAAPGTFDCGWNGGDDGGTIAFYGVRFYDGGPTPVSDWWLQNCNVVLGFCEFDGTNAGPRIRGNAPMVATAHWGFASIILMDSHAVLVGVGPSDTNRYDGVHFHQGMGGNQSAPFLYYGKLYLNGCVFQNGSISVGSGPSFGMGASGVYSTLSCSFHYPIASGAVALVIDGNGYDISFAGRACGVIGGAWFHVNGNAALIRVDGSDANIANIDVLNTYGSGIDGIIVEHGSTVQGSGLQNNGAALTGIGVRVLHGRVFVSDPVSGTAIAGTGGAVQVGSAPVQPDWTGILGGTTAAVSDIGQPNTRMCYCGMA